MRVARLYKEFFDSEKAGGLILLACTVISLTLANSFVGDAYQKIWLYELAGHSAVHWINDGLMTIFFLLIGLELEREIYLGKLSKIKEALFPFFAAIGGILLPICFFLYFNWGKDTQSGAGIPMATDIAFALGILSLLGNRVPTSMKVFLTAFAVIDDLAAIIIIALAYSQALRWECLAMAFSVFVLLVILNRMKVKSLVPYLIGGIAMWYLMLHSGIHATITGVLLAFVIPFGKGYEDSPSFILQHILHKPVAFVILPVFALANTAIVLNGEIGDSLLQDYSLGIATGLILGKPLGIFLLTFLTVKSGLSRLPESLNWTSILGVGFLGGIGFTMSIFITLLAYQDIAIINSAKFVILLSSLAAGTIGLFILKKSLGNRNDETK